MKKGNKPFVVIINGLTAHSQDYRFIPIVDQLYNGVDGRPGMDVINVNHRGLAGAKLTTARMYCCGAIGDIVEPLVSLY